MDTFLKNYWSLYNEFLIAFEPLHYKGISLPYVCHFPSFIPKDGTLWKQLKDPTFVKHLQTEISHQKEIQQKFNQFMLRQTSKVHKGKPNGKVAIHVDKLLRFPQNTFFKSFDGNKTILLIAQGKPRRKKKQVSMNGTQTIDGGTSRMKCQQANRKGINNMATYYLEPFTASIQGDISQLQKQTREIFKRNEQHHVFGRNEFQQWLLEKIKIVMEHIVTAEWFFDNNQINCLIVSTTHSYISRILTVVAAKRGISTICMQHGIISSELGYIPKIATVDAVYGHFEKDFYESLGVPKNSIELIGHPRFDQVQKFTSFLRKRDYQKLQLDSKKKTILLVVRENQLIDQWRSFIQTISKQQQVNILVKNYPSRQEHPLVKEFPFVYSTENMELYDLFPLVDVVVSYASTVALEAMLAKKHVFVLKDKIEGDRFYYDRLDYCVQKDPIRLASLVTAYLANATVKNELEKKRKKFLQYAYPNAKPSSVRLKELVSKLID